LRFNIAVSSFSLLAVLVFHSSTGITASKEAFDIAARTGHRTLVIGKVSNDPRKHYRYLKPIVEYVAQKMEDLGVVDSSVLMARDNAQMIEYLKSGRVDWVTDTAFSSLLYEHYQAAEILVKKWKKNASEYRTVFFALKDSRINDLTDLRGKKIVLEDPGSTTAFYQPFLCLFNEGLELEKLESVEQSPSPGKVGYVYSYQEINSSMWVHKKLVDAGAFNNQDWEKNDHIYKNIKKGMKIFYETGSMPRAFESVRRGLDPRIKARLREILLNIDKDSKAGGILDSYQKTKRFTSLDKETRLELEKMRNDLNTVLKAIEQ
jgi:phosphonate transport system substrate-binding protein